MDHGPSLPPSLIPPDCRETRVFHVSADGEVIKALKRAIPQPKHLVDGIVEETADARRAQARGLGDLALLLSHLALSLDTHGTTQDVGFISRVMAHGNPGYRLRLNSGR